MRLRSLLLLSGAALLAAACAGAGGGYAGIAQRGDLMRAEQAYARGHFVEAAQFVDAALHQTAPTQEVDAAASLLLARSLDRLERVSAAVYVYRYVAQLHLDSTQGEQARARLRELDPGLQQAPPPGGEWPRVFLPVSMQLARPWLRRPALIFFPNAAALAGRQGSATLALQVREDGELESSELIEASDPGFARAAAGAARDFELDAAAFEGDAFPRRKVVTLRFQRTAP